MFTKQVKTLSLHFNQHVEHTLCMVDMKWVHDDRGRGKMSKRGRRGGGGEEGEGRKGIEGKCWEKKEGQTDDPPGTCHSRGYFSISFG